MKNLTMGKIWDLQITERPSTLQYFDKTFFTSDITANNNHYFCQHPFRLLKSRETFRSSTAASKNKEVSVKSLKLADINKILISSEYAASSAIRPNLLPRRPFLF